MFIYLESNYLDFLLNISSWNWIDPCFYISRISYFYHNHCIADIFLSDKVTFIVYQENIKSTLDIGKHF